MDACDKAGVALSVLNAHPQLLEGPRLLHHLINFERRNASLAIDSLEPGESRRRISYRLLDQLSDAVAHRISRILRARAASSAPVVPVLIPQCPALYIALLGILKAGASFCPLPLDAPAERVKFIIQDVSADLTVTTSASTSRLAGYEGLEIVDVDTLLEEMDPEVPKYPENPIDPANLAYVMYTSGSTGKPKGVGISHLAATQSLLAHDQHIPSFSRFLQFAAPTFDVFVFETFFPLFRGSTLISCDRSEMLADLPGMMNKMEVDAAELTPTVAGGLLCYRSRVPRLKLLLTIGEMLTSAIVHEFGGDSTKESLLWAMYGPTEAAIHCSLQPNFQTTYSVGNIGAPLETVSCFIIKPLDPYGLHPSTIELLPVGEIGELVLGGHQLAVGYLNRPEQTDAAFVHHKVYGRLYRTGDKARLLNDGTLECLGRISTGQVKLRGQRIELGEIEQVAYKVPGCRTVVASVIDDVLVAFILAVSCDVTPVQILEACKQWLPAFMVPGDIVFLDEFPQLPSGKVDRKRLEQEYRDNKGLLHSDYEEDWTEEEDLVVNIIQDTLGCSLTRTSNLAACGLDSLRAIRAASRLRSARFNLSVAEVLAARDMGELLDVVKRKQGNTPDFRIQGHQGDLLDSFKDSVSGIAELGRYKDDIETILPATPLQASMLAETAVDPGAYCNWIEVELSSSLDYAAVRKSLCALADHNEILRSGFQSTGNPDFPFAQIIWKKLAATQISPVESFNRQYEIASAESLLRPFSCQVLTRGSTSRLLFQIHHSLYDGWSFDLIMQDLSDLLHGRPVPQRPQFGAVNEYYSLLLSSRLLQSAEKYWQDQLQGFNPNSLPNLNGHLTPKPEISSVTRSFPRSLRSLQACAARLSISPQVFFQAALAQLIGSYVGDDDVGIGIVTSGRTISVSGIEDIIGPCISTLPLRVRLGKQSVKGLLQSIHNQNRGLVEHCTLPLGQVKKVCGLLPGNQLFDVVLVWQETLQSLDGSTCSIRQIDSADRLEFKITIELEPKGEDIEAKVTYWTSALPKTHADILLQQLEQLVGFYSTRVDKPIEDAMHALSEASLSVANPNYQHQNVTEGPSRAVERRALETPDATALSFASLERNVIVEVERLTYQSLNSRSNRLAHLLVQHGAVPDGLVCIFMEKSVDLYVSILATLKTGSGYLPITPDTPSERVDLILREAKIKLCVSNSAVSGKVTLGGSPYILNLDRVDLSEYSDQNLAIPYIGSHVAYTVFTSGSTGTPKGVVVTMDNIMSNLSVLRELYPVGSGARLLQSCSQAFDVSVFEILFSWYTGMCLCSATKDDLFHDLEDAIRRLQITHLSLTPTVAALVDPNNVPSVEFLVTAGEAVTEHVRRLWCDRGLYQGYGPSETTNICTVNPNVTSHDLINNIGPPFKNTSAFVYQPGSDALVPLGGVGEFCFGGDQVFRGYLNMPELTSSKIINHPRYGRIYRSGDIGRMLADGSLLFASRADDQVKIRGQRVELGEVNSCVLDDRNVRDCCTIMHNSTEQGAQKLITFWVPFQHSSVNFSLVDISAGIARENQALFEALTSRLPAYMVPNHLIPVTTIPMTHQSKVDKRRLVSAFESLSIKQQELFSRNACEVNDTREWSQLERQIADSLSRVLKIHPTEIGLTSSFFGLGLDSISAVAFSKDLGLFGDARIPISAILKNNTVAHLAQWIAQRGNALVQSSRSVDVRKVFGEHEVTQIRSIFAVYGKEIEKILPCTPLQEAMLSAPAHSSPLTYLNRMLFDFHGDLDRFKYSWEIMGKRHEILRTCFIPTENRHFPYAQVVLKGERLEIEDVTVNADLDSELEHYYHGLLTDMKDQSRPPVRLAMVSWESHRTFSVCCHHALYDGGAIAILLQEVEQVYLGNASLPKPISFEPFLQEMLSLSLESADCYWASCLKGFEPNSFPDLTSRPASPERSCGPHSCFKQPLDLPLSKVNELCRHYSTTLLALMQAAWAKSLSGFLGVADVCFGNVVSGRALPLDGIDRLVAPCFNTLPVRVDLRTSKTNRDLLLTLQRLNAESLPFQTTPLRRILRKQSYDGQHLFDTLFILQQPSREFDTRLWSLREDLGEMDFPVVCEVVPSRSHDNLTLSLHYHPSVLSDHDVQAVFEIYSIALKTLIDYPTSESIRLAGLPATLSSFQSEGPRLQTHDTGALLHSGFEEVSKSSPDALCLDFLHGNGQQTKWTFRELDETANQIAHLILRHHPSLEEPVPIYMPKSPLFYASVLGVLKAGGAFTPIDLRLPEARKKYMVAELRANLILTISSIDCSWCEGLSVVDVSAHGSQPKVRPLIDGLNDSSLAYRLYTSGSTGQPKAVSMEHRGPMNTIESSKSIIPWNTSSRLLQYAAITFDMCYYDCFLAWSLGFTLCSAEQAVMLNDLPATVNTLEATILDLTPSVAGSITPSLVPTVKYLYCIGEAMPSQLIELWGSKCVNSYGPTEAAFCVTIYPVSKKVKSTVFGRPFPSTSFIVMSPFGDFEVPKLQIGELFLGGRQLAREYHANASLTASRFVTKDGHRWYRTGDLVRRLTNGEYEFIGRTDDQIKIRGLRVELDEINYILRDAHEAIKNVTTQILRPTDDAKEQLVAFLAVAEHAGKTLDKGAVIEAARDQAMKQLPSYMIPNFFLVIDNIPLSLAGKVDKKLLLQIFRQSEELRVVADEDQEGEGDWSDVEIDIREVFSRLSGTEGDRIRKGTTVYQLGLDSISAMQVAAALRKYGYELSASDVLEHPTCSDLAKCISNISPSTPVLEDFNFKDFEMQLRLANHFDYSDIIAIRPCTPLQSGILAKFLQSDGRVYLNSLTFRAEPGIDAKTVEDACKSVVQKHEMLRTGFIHTKHAQYPFAMVTYDQIRTHCSTINLDNDSQLDVRHWKETISTKIKDSLHQPPWHLLLVQESDALYMHLFILHALFDAYSLQMILEDLAAACYKEPLGVSSPVEPILSCLLVASQTKNEEQQSYWIDAGKDMLINRFPDLTPLRTSSRESGVAHKKLSYSRKDFESGCRAANITMQAAGQAAWARVLSAYVGEPAVTFGVVLSGRTFRGADKVAFPCITTVPLACKLRQNNHELLEDMMRYNASIQKHQFTPLTEIQRLTGHANEPLFDTIFAYQKITNGRKGAQPWQVIAEEASADYALSVELEPLSDDDLGLRITFGKDLLPPEQAVLLLDQLEAVFADVIFHPDGDFTELSTRSPSIYSITPPKEREIDSDVMLLHEFVERSARLYPTQTAFEFASAICGENVISQTWTYEQLDAEGNKVAHLLLSNGVRPGSLVAVSFDKCPEASFAMLGVLKAGCGFLALDPGAPAARKAFIIQDADAKALISMQAQSAAMKDNISVPVLDLDIISTDCFPSSRPELVRQISPQDTSYCLYTSGTTGRPKGCLLSHENAVQAMLAFTRLFSGHWDGDSRWLQFASFHFDVSVLEQYWSWSVGIRVVSAPRDLIFEDLAGTIDKLGITHIDLTPSLARLITPEDCPSLCRGVFITGGEALRQDILDAWGPKCVIYNGYGPTEATIGVTMYPRVPANGKPSNIGPQFDNVGSYVFVPNTEVPVLRGAVGELCVSGKLVGKGYINRDDLTREKFPTLRQFNDRVYRTGDLVRSLHDNTFDFLGRIDDQVKLRGQRLEIGEINSVIKRSAKDIQDVTTLVLKHRAQQREQLVSFVVTKHIWQKNRPPTVLVEDFPELVAAKEACQSQLPGYMVPTYFIPLTTVPLSPNNKADAKALKAMYASLSTAELQTLSRFGEASSQVWTETEIKIRHVLSEMTQTSEAEITRSSSIFELGLDSISVIGFSKELSGAGFSHASASLIMKNPRIIQLAQVLKDKPLDHMDHNSILASKRAISACQHLYKSLAAQTLDVKLGDIESMAPCTPLQEGIISRSLNSEEPMYFGTFSFQLSHATDVARLRKAWEQVVASSQILRTCFVPTQEGFVQVAINGKPLPWQEICISNKEEACDTLSDLRTRWWKENTETIQKPFEVNLLRAPGQTIMAVHLFHAIYDGSSLPLIFDRLLAEYRGDRSIEYGPPFYDVLPYGPLRKVEGAQSFWIGHLGQGNFKPLPMLTAASTEKGTIETLEMPGLAQFETLRRSLGVTGQAIVQACWSATLAKHFRQAMTLGLVVSGRSIDFEGADLVIGPLFNTIPFLAPIDIRDNWAAFIRKCHDFNTAALPYQNTALRDIMKWCKRNVNEPFFDTLFVFQKRSSEVDHAERNEVWELMDDEAQADYALAFEAEQAQNGDLKLTIVAKGYISTEEHSSQLLHTFQDLLSTALEGVEKPISESLGVLSPDTSFKGYETNPTKTNGHLTNGWHTFEWTEEARIVREEIASLAGLAPSDVNETTSIFEVGLDSIDAIKLSSRLKERSLSIPVSAIMRSLTIPKMMQNLTTQGSELSSSTGLLENLEAQCEKLMAYLQQDHRCLSDVERVLPVTPLQEAMVAEMLSSNFERYYNHDVLRLSPETDISKLQDAWRIVTDNSPILRTSFANVYDPELEASFAQIVHKPRGINWIRIDLDTPADIYTYLRDITSQAQASDEHDVHFRLTHIRCAPEDYIVLTISHALYDGWSLSLLHEDVGRAYRGEYQARPSYDKMLAMILHSSGAAAHKFWADSLSGAKRVPFPRKHPEGPAQRTNVHRRETISKLTVAALRSFSRNCGVTLQAIGQTCWSFVLAEHIRSLDVAFGVVLSGRDTPEANELLFPSMNTVAIRSIIHGSRKEMLRYMQSNINNVRQYQHYPLRKALALAGESGRSLFDTLFIYQNRPELVSTGTRPLCESVGGASDVEYPVCVEMETWNDTLIWRCACRDTALDGDETASLLEELDQTLTELLSSPDSEAICITDNGISVCGMAAFSIDESHNSQRTPTGIDLSKPQISDWSSTEIIIRQIFSSISKVPEADISRDMNMFHLGLDSISAIKVSGLLRKKGIKLSVSEMLRAGTVANIAHLADNSKQTELIPAANAKDAIEAALKPIDVASLVQNHDTIGDVEMILPATAGQIYMLSVWQNTRGTLFYPTFNYRMEKRVDLEGLHQAWDKLVAAVPVLRTRFIASGNAEIPFLQAVARENPSSFTTENTGCDRQPFVTLAVSESNEAFSLNLRIHHALYDGVSLPILMQHLEDLCNGLPLSVASADKFGHFISLGISAASYAKRKAFWMHYLDEYSPGLLLPQPAGVSGPRIEMFNPVVVKDVSALESLSRKAGLTLHAFFLAAYSKIYARLSDASRSADIVIGLYLANRSHAIDGLDQLAAPTVNLVPLRVTAPLQRRLADIAGDVQRDLQRIGSPENSATGLWEIWQWTGVKVDTFVNFLKLPDGSDGKSGGGAPAVRIEEAMETREEARAKVVAPRGGEFEVPEELKANVVGDAYVHSLDIEATIKNGCLGMGIFAREEMLGLDGAQSIYEEMRNLLTEDNLI